MKNQGQSNGKSKLKLEQVLEIRRRLRNYEKGVDIARLLGVSVSQVSKIKHGRQWKWLPLMEGQEPFPAPLRRDYHVPLPPSPTYPGVDFSALGNESWPSEEEKRLAPTPV